MKIVPIGFKENNQSTITDPKVIIDFLAGRGTDHKGRTIFDMLDYDDTVMEQCHDSIQFLFMLHEESNFARTYPIITPEIVEEANKDPFVKKHLIWAANRMKKFYGFDNHNFDVNRFYSWLGERNHNLLRITRIIRSLRLFGLDEEAREFYNKASEAYDFIDHNNEDPSFVIDEDAPFYWEKAMKDGMWESLR